MPQAIANTHAPTPGQLGRSWDVKPTHTNAQRQTAAVCGRSNMLNQEQISRLTQANLSMNRTALTKGQGGMWLQKRC